MKGDTVTNSSPEQPSATMRITPDGAIRFDVQGCPDHKLVYSCPHSAGCLACGIGFGEAPDPCLKADATEPKP